MSEKSPESVDETVDQTATDEAKKTEVEQSKPDKGKDYEIYPDDHPLVTALAAHKEREEKLQKRIQEFEEAQMTEDQKVAARLKAAEERAAALEAANDRKDIVIEFGLSKEDAEILDGITDIDAMKRIAARLATPEEPEKRTPKPHPAQMQGGDTPPEDDDAIARQFFGIK